jgi:hypothetical protein
VEERHGCKEAEMIEPAKLSELETEKEKGTLENFRENAGL